MTDSARIQEALAGVTFTGVEVDMPSMYAAVAVLKGLPTPRNAIPDMFRWFEANSDKYLGGPGPFVTFIEEQGNYVELLRQSLARKPTDHTVYMANRLANTTSDVDALSSWIALLEAAARHPDADEDCRQSAREFAERQKGRRDGA